jgi:hypothetical protein
MPVLINRKDCATSIKNLGVPDCLVENGRITGMIAVNPSWSIDTVTDTFNQTTVNELIQDGTFVPVMGAVEVVNGTPEATTEEYQGGVMSVVRNGLVMLTYKFLKGWAYARALYSMNSFQQYSILLVFEDGSIAGAIDGTTFSGYSTGMFNTGTFMHTDGAVSGYSNTVIQLTSQTEYNLNTAVLDRSAIGFDANKLLPITDIIMTGRADVSEQKVYFKPTFAMNESEVLRGIQISNLRFTIDGVVDTIVALSLTYEPTTQEWSFEPTTTIATSDDLVVSLTSVAVQDVAQIGSRYYKGGTTVFNAVA